MIFYKALFWFTVALLWAIAEIEIEGKYGWAEKSQTWYRTLEHHKKSLFLKYILLGKPLTGYHPPVFLLALAFSHAHFFMGIRWTVAEELTALALWLTWTPLWDNLWIIFNPHYGVGNNAEKRIWWYSKSYWIANLFPLENVFQWAVSLVFASLASLTSGTFFYLEQHLYLMSLFLLFGFLSTFTLVPLYRRYYSLMRKHDDRKSAGIFH